MTLRSVVCAVALLFLAPTTCLAANSVGFREVDTNAGGSGCVGSICNFESARANLSVSSAWAPDSNDIVFGELAFQNAAGTIYAQIGYAKVGSADTLADCGANGNSRAVVFIWRGSSDSSEHCVWGQNVTAGENHTVKLSRCQLAATTDWCSYVDGSELGSVENLGVSSFKIVEAGGEKVLHNTDGGFSITIGGAGGPLWQVSNAPNISNGSWTDVPGSATCLKNTFGDFMVGTVGNPPASWGVSTGSGTVNAGC